MRSADETRLIEVLITHNEPVSSEDLACALGMTRDGVHHVAVRLQALGFVVLDEANDTVAATSSATTALPGGRS